MNIFNLIFSYLNCFHFFFNKKKNNEESISIDQEWSNILNDISSSEFELVNI